MTATTDQPDTVESRIAALEKRLTQIQYKRDPAHPAADLAVARAAAADIWVVTGPGGRVYLFLAYLPSVLVSGDVCGTWFTPHDDRFPPVSHPDYATLG